MLVKKVEFIFHVPFFAHTPTMLEKINSNRLLTKIFPNPSQNNINIELLEFPQK
jgi:hypothetical protein